MVGGTDHTSHRLILLGFGPQQVTVLLIGGTALSCLLGVLVAEGVVSPWLAAPLALVPAAALLVLLLRIGTYSGDDKGRAELIRRRPEDESGD
jgi:hypothetical protein